MVEYLGGSAADFFYVDHFRKRVVLMRRQDDGKMEPESHPLSCLGIMVVATNSAGWSGLFLDVAELSGMVFSVFFCSLSVVRPCGCSSRRRKAQFLGSRKPRQSNNSLNSECWILLCVERVKLFLCLFF
jgi:hypothetical protein